jgi:hypothetical protein
MLEVGTHAHTRTKRERSVLDAAGTGPARFFGIQPEPKRWMLYYLDRRG